MASDKLVYLRETQYYKVSVARKKLIKEGESKRRGKEEEGEKDLQIGEKRKR